MEAETPREQRLANDLYNLRGKPLLGFLLSFTLMGLVVYGITPAYTSNPPPVWVDHVYMAFSRQVVGEGLAVHVLV